ncbi:hypothetical protein JHK84_055391 [Glycine max]|nr:hypothetical protein JHK84_055391 [Glycine max]
MNWDHQCYTLFPQGILIYLINFVLLISRQGKVRLTKWYSPYSQKERSKVIRELSGMILSRAPKQCNFVEWRGHKVVYKRYASLYFCMCIDQDDNELEVLEMIHHFVEILDRYFGSVCELDLIFNFHKAYYILDEILIAGELQESSKKTVARLIAAQDSLVENAKEEASSFSNIIAQATNGVSSLMMVLFVLHRSSLILPQQKTFAKVVQHACTIPLSQLLVLCLKGNALSITIPEEECKVGQWQMIPLGNNFFGFSSALGEDLCKLFAIGSLSLNQSVSSFLWTLDFHSNDVCQSNAQCRVRIYNLPQEYWRENILFAIARGVGVPLALNEATNN